MVHKACHEEYPMSQTNHYGPYVSSDAQLTDKPHEVGSDDNVEGRDEKKMSGPGEDATHKTSA
jgi:hypothetical protein